MATVIDVIVRDKPRPDHGIRAGLGVLQLERGCGAERLDAACARALVLNACSLKSITSILSNRREDQPVDAAPDEPPIAHGNIRGPKYFH